MLVAVQWLLRFVVPKIAPVPTVVPVLGALVAALLILVWWVFFSRARWVERLAVPAVIVGLMFATHPFLDPSIATSMLGMAFPILALPVICLALVLWAVVTRNLVGMSRLVSLVLFIAAACAIFPMLRTEGITSGGDSALSLRWAESHEDRLVAAGDETVSVARDAAPVGEADWPGFRGYQRDGIVRGPRIATDWQAEPPVLLWKQPIGPGWSSFAVAGSLAFTQEQRGDEELVTAYDLESGEPVWRHRESTRFFESTGGGGPRSTPTLDSGRLFSLGANGALNAFDASSGEVIWERDLAADTDQEIPYYGYSSSPLVVDDLVLVAAGGQLVAYAADSGERRWLGQDMRASYSSPHRFTIDGVSQIVHSSVNGLIGVSPDSGRLLWQYDWEGGVRIVQPAITEEGDLLLSEGEGRGVRRLTLRQAGDGWSVEEVWTSNRLKPYHNDFVVHEGHAYGFDGGILACIGLDDGQRRWKGGRYGQGQLVLLAEQSVLLLVTEMGDLALVRASPEGFEELATVPALEGKTWNHPVVIHDLLLVRNSHEMAAYRLPLS